MNATAAATTTTTKAAKKPSKTRAPKAPTGSSITLGELGDKYLKHLEQTGKSRGTVFSYSAELDLAKADLGADTPIDSLTPTQVTKFFESDIVTKTRKGRAKAAPTVAKTRRVLRLALTWALKQKLLDKTPIPAEKTSENA